MEWLERSEREAANARKPLLCEIAWYSGIAVGPAGSSSDPTSMPLAANSTSSMVVGVGVESSHGRVPVVVVELVEGKD